MSPIINPRYIPDRGDVIDIDFDPQTGHEQAKRRPALVLSKANFNSLTGFALVCPITHTFNNHAFEVIIPPGLEVDGIILTQQVKSLDWQARYAVFRCKMPDFPLREAAGKVMAILR